MFSMRDTTTQTLREKRTVSSLKSSKLDPFFVSIKAKFLRILTLVMATVMCWSFATVAFLKISPLRASCFVLLIFVFLAKKSQKNAKLNPFSCLD